MCALAALAARTLAVAWWLAGRASGNEQPMNNIRKFYMTDIELITQVAAKPDRAVEWGARDRSRSAEARRER
uniref:Putative secreted protein n=1 Tax=Anopheles triannulatus TaxID=58253 RepID=A0A2M4B5J3_9DIPT